MSSNAIAVDSGQRNGHCFSLEIWAYAVVKFMFQRNAATKCIYELEVISKLSVTHYLVNCSDRGLDAKELQSVEKMY
ncbi:hypothetical protein DAI22_03g025200 [Oryza sativa Japonica Group]|jgi:hypothetical protein|nr:hypothetical protein DAI22_03g025200 [Oryza sativa Japonica Group]